MIFRQKKQGRAFFICLAFSLFGVVCCGKISINIKGISLITNNVQYVTEPPKNFKNKSFTDIYIPIN